MRIMTGFAGNFVIQVTPPFLNDCRRCHIFMPKLPAKPVDCQIFLEELSYSIVFAHSAFKDFSLIIKIQEFLFDVCYFIGRRGIENNEEQC